MPKHGFGGGRRAARTTGDRGAGTAVALGLAAATIALAGMLAPVAGIAAARHRAAAAADAAALAAAATAAGLAASEDPCAVAAALAARHSAALRRCELDELTATVEAVVRTPLGEVAARATAGPDRADGAA